MSEPKTKPKTKPKPKPKLLPDVATNCGPAVYTVRVSEVEAALLQSRFGFRPTSRAGGLITMTATARALAMYRGAA